MFYLSRSRHRAYSRPLRSCCVLLGATGLWSKRRIGNRDLPAVERIHVIISHRVSIDVPMTCFQPLPLIFAVILQKVGYARYAMLAAMFAVLAATTKITRFLVLSPAPDSHGYGSAGMAAWPARILKAPELWLSALLFAVVLIATFRDRVRCQLSVIVQHAEPTPRWTTRLFCGVWQWHAEEPAESLPVLCRCAAAFDRLPAIQSRCDIRRLCRVEAPHRRRLCCFPSA